MKMYKTMQRLLLIQVIFFISISILAQNVQKSDSIINLLNYEKLILPDLDECIQTAIVNSPILKSTDQQTLKLLEEIKIKKKSWLDYLLIDANSRYGLYNQLSVTETTGVTLPDLAIRSDKEQFNYFVGLTIKLPLSYFVNGKNEQKILKLEVKESELKKEELKNELKRLVTIEYFKLRNYYEILEIQQSNLQTNQLNYLKSKKDLQNGFLDLAEFTRLSTLYTKSFEDFSKTKNDYYTQYYILRILTGTNLQKVSK